MYSEYIVFTRCVYCSRSFVKTVIHNKHTSEAQIIFLCRSFYQFKALRLLRQTTTTNLLYSCFLFFFLCVIARSFARTFCGLLKNMQIITEINPNENEFFSLVSLLSFLWIDLRSTEFRKKCKVILKENSERKVSYNQELLTDFIYIPVLITFIQFTRDFNFDYYF